MHIYLKKKFLYFRDYKIKCSIGKRGLTSRKREGDLKTPKGSFGFNLLYYRADRIKNIKTKIKRKKIQKKFGWCDDPSSKYYNKLIQFPFRGTAEKLYLGNNMYDIILVLNFNTKPVVKNRGSAIFLHITNKKFNYTKGCLAVKKRDLIKILPFINRRTKIIIS
tara:strand:+ start:273 stop:764 length:492 start_codon:yes stop_codon:yes gene_type:complete